MNNLLSLLVETLAGFMFLQSSALKTNINLKHTLFQIKMDSIQNNLKPEIKEEAEEEKIDIENHFHPIISSFEEDQLTRSVCSISFILEIKHVSSRNLG